MNFVRGSYQDELDRFFKTLFRFNVAKRIVSKASLAKARLKLKYQAFIELNSHLISYFEKHFNPKTWNGFRLLTIDGSLIRLPHTEDIARHFGQWHVRQGRPSPMARISQLETLIRSLSRFSEKTLLILSGKSDVSADAVKIEASIFFDQRDLFSGLDLVFFDTTSIYFEGRGGKTIGKRGFSKDHRSDLNQMVVGAIIDDKGKPICCEMWPGNTTDVKTLIPVVDRVRKRFGINCFCVVDDRGMISADTIKELESRKIPYILGRRMRRVKEIRVDVLSYGGRYREVYPEGLTSKDPSPLKVKEVLHNKKRYIVCLEREIIRQRKTNRPSSCLLNSSSGP